MPNNMPDTRAINEALRRAREMQARSAPAPQEPPAPEPKPDPEPVPEPAQRRAEPAEKTASGQGSLIDTLLRDKERTLILALLILLSGEGGNTELLFALMYLLI